MSVVLEPTLKRRRKGQSGTGETWGDFDEMLGDEGCWDVTVKRKEHVSKGSKSTLEVATKRK